MYGMENNRLTFVVFLECELRGNWSDPVIDDAITHGVDPEDLLTTSPPNTEQHICQGDNCELWLVRPDGLRRAWHFKENHGFIIRGNVVSFNQLSIVDELSVDDTKKTS
jgi:hypothetical protein